MLAFSKQERYKKSPMTSTTDPRSIEPRFDPVRIYSVVGVNSTGFNVGSNSPKNASSFFWFQDSFTKGGPDTKAYRRYRKPHRIPLNRGQARTITPSSVVSPIRQSEPLKSNPSANQAQGPKTNSLPTPTTHRRDRVRTSQEVARPHAKPSISAPIMAFSQSHVSERRANPQCPITLSIEALKAQIIASFKGIQSCDGLLGGSQRAYQEALC